MGQGINVATVLYRIVERVHFCIRMYAGTKTTIAKPQVFRVQS